MQNKLSNKLIKRHIVKPLGNSYMVGTPLSIIKGQASTVTFSVYEDSYELDILYGLLKIRNLLYNCSNIEVICNAIFSYSCEANKINQIFKYINNITQETNLKILGGDSIATSFKDNSTIAILNFTALAMGNNISERLNKKPLYIYQINRLARNSASYISNYIDKSSSKINNWIYQNYNEIDKSAIELCIENLDNKAFELIMLTTGGLFQGLWELGESYDSGLKIDMEKVLIDQETIELCHSLRINPYTLDGQGTYILLTSCDNLENIPMNISLIGNLENNRDRVLEYRGELRFLNNSYSDELGRYYERKNT